MTTYSDFADAVAAAPNDANFISYLAREDVWMVIFCYSTENPDLSFYETIFSGNGRALSLLMIGISECGLSLWDHEKKRFVCGNPEQLTRINKED